MKDKITYSELITLSNNFINENMKVKDNYNDSLLEFALLNDFIKKYNKVIDLNFSINLLNKNILLYNIIGTIFFNISKLNKHNLIINSSILNKFEDQDILKNFLIAYCIINKIEVMDDEYGLEIEKLETAFSVDEINLVKIYISQLTKKILTKKEEIELGKRKLNGDKKARNELIEANLKLVVSIAKKYTNRGLSLEDLIQEGNTGLVKAADNYDVNKGYRFSTFATSYIKGYIIRAIENKTRSIKIPNNVQPKLKKFKYDVDLLTKQLGKMPSIKEISDNLNIDEDKVTEYLMLDYDIDSLNKTFGEEFDTELIDFIENDDEPVYTLLELESLRSDLKRLIEISNLTEKEKQIINLKFFTKELNTYRQIAEYLGISHQAVQESCQRAIIKLRGMDKTKELLVYSNNPIKSLEMIKQTNEENERLRQEKIKKNEEEKSKVIKTKKRRKKRKKKSKKMV